MNKFIIFLLLFVVIVNFNVFSNDLPDVNVTFEFDEVPISYAFNAICKSNNINLVFGDDPDINKLITLDLNGININQALEMIILNTNLSYVYEDGVLVVANKNSINDKYNKSLITVPGNTALLINDTKSESASLIVNQNIPEDEPIDPGFRISKGVNQGILIPAKLEVGLISSSQELPALVRVSKNISYEDKIIIPKGSLFYGFGVTDFNARQIFIKLDKLILGDREIDIKAHLVKGNGDSGFCSEYRDLEMEKFWPTFLMGFAGMLSNGLKDKYYIEDSEGNKQPVEADSLKNDLIDSSQEGVNAWTNQLMNDAKKHNAIITVEAGIEGFVFVDEKILLNKFNDQL